MIARSDLLSPEFKRFRDQGTEPQHAALVARVPARTASKSEWDKFDAWFDETYNREPLRRALSRYLVQVEETTVAGVRAAIVSPQAGIAPENSGRILINLHGGGFVFHRGLRCGQLESIPVAALGRIKVVTLDYRQAPFHHHPAACEDVEAVYLKLLKHYRPAAIGIYGCSAGAVLAAQAVARFQSKNLPRPGAIGMFSMAPPPPYPTVPPWEPAWGESGVWFATGPHNQPSPADRRVWEAVQWYMEQADPADPMAYPGNSDAVIAAFPPTLFLSGTRDFAASTIIAAHARFLKLRVQSSLYLMEGVAHLEHVLAIGTPEAHDAHAYTAHWFQQHLASHA